MSPYMNSSKFVKIASTIYHSFAKESVKIRFLISDVSAGNLTMCHEKRVARSCGSDLQPPYHVLTKWTKTIVRHLTIKLDFAYLYFFNCCDFVNKPERLWKYQVTQSSMCCFSFTLSNTDAVQISSILVAKVVFISFFFRFKIREKVLVWKTKHSRKQSQSSTWRSEDKLSINDILLYW